MFRAIFWGGERRKLSAIGGRKSCAGEVSHLGIRNERVAVKDGSKESGVTVHS